MCVYVNVVCNVCVCECGVVMCVYMCMWCVHVCVFVIVHIQKIHEGKFTAYLFIT